MSNKGPTIILIVAFHFDHYDETLSLALLSLVRLCIFSNTNNSVLDIVDSRRHCFTLLCSQSTGSPSLGDTQTLECQNDSFSNIVYQTDQEQFDACNMSANDGKHRVIVECYGGILMGSSLDIRQLFYFVGKTYYFCQVH